MKQTERVKNLCETALFIAIVFLGVLDVYKRQTLGSIK